MAEQELLSDEGDVKLVNVLTATPTMAYSKQQLMNFMIITYHSSHSAAML